MDQDRNELMKQIMLQHWTATNLKIEKSLESITDVQYSSPIVSGRSTPAWVFCHLLKINDDLLPILGLGTNQYPRLHEVMNDKNIAPHTVFSKNELNDMWLHVGSLLLRHFNKMTGEQRIQKHTNISEEDFQKEPHRNKMNVVLHRLIHMSHHAGQLALIR